jgi:hypothetical protein
MLAAEKLILEKIDGFIRKYYKNLLIKGTLIASGIQLTLYLAFISFEYYIYFSPWWRLSLLFIFIIVFSATLGFLVIRPLLKMLRLLKGITHDEAARILGKDLEGVDDKLLNTLQLIDLKNRSKKTEDLLIAGIEQKISSLQPISFGKLIKLRRNFSYSTYVLGPILLIICLLILSPSFLKEPTSRYIHFSEKYEKPAPFKFVLLSKSMEVIQQEDFTVDILTLGEYVPSEMYLINGTSADKMQKIKGNLFRYTFRSLQNSVEFYCTADKLESQKYTIVVNPRPQILDFTIHLVYPPYTRRESENLKNIGDLRVPEGTVASWSFLTKSAERLNMLFTSGKLMDLREAKGYFNYSRILLQNTEYCVVPVNSFVKKGDSLNYKIIVIKDGFPEITLKETTDSSMSRRLFIEGHIRDDYGFTKLMFTLKGRINGDTSLKVLKNEQIALRKDESSQVFYHDIDIGGVNPSPGDSYEFYYEIWDNDAVNGPKFTKSSFFSYKIPSLEEMAKEAEQYARDVTSGLDKSLKDSKNNSKSIDEISRTIIEQKDFSWKEKKKIEDIIKRAENIENRTEEYKKATSQLIENEQKFKEVNERILKKQKQLNELAQDILTDEMKKTIQEMRNLLQQFDKNKLNELLPKLQKQNEELEKELDRNLDLFKKIDFERRLDEKVQELNKLSEKLQLLSENQEQLNENKSSEQEELKNITDRYDTLKSGIEKLEREEKQERYEMNLEQTKELREKIDHDLDQANDALKNKKEGEAKKKEKKSGEQMKELADNLASLQQEAEDAQNEEDAESVNLLIQNLTELSFKQEDLIYRTGTINRNDPKFLEIIDNQQDIRTGFKNICDSLEAIGKRQVMMASMINRITSDVKMNMVNAEKALNDRNLLIATAREQYVMTGVNDLANILAEFLKQMNESMNSSSSNQGQKMCNKPSKPGGKKSLKSLSQLQQQMTKKLEKMKEGMGKNGDRGSKMEERAGERETLSKEIAKMAAEQEMIRQAMREYENSLKEAGEKNTGSLNKMIEEMEKNEKDIINNRITQETIDRQQKIVSRMLESEKAEQEREKEERRESTEAKNYKTSNPEQNFKYKRKTEAGRDILKFEPLRLKDYYQDKSEEYFIKITR